VVTQVLVIAKLLDLGFGFFFRDAIELLQLACEHVLVTFDLFQMVIGEFSPLLADFAGQLFPVAFDLVPIHGDSFRLLVFLLSLDQLIVFSSYPAPAPADVVKWLKPASEWAVSQKKPLVKDFSYRLFRKICMAEGAIWPTLAV
jgi:hypothetical protein